MSTAHHQEIALGHQRLGGLAPLLDPAYRVLWPSTLSMNVARWMDQVVIGWLVLILTDSPWQVMVFGFYRMAPSLALGVFVGAIVDRVDRKRLLVAFQAINILVSFAIVFLLLVEKLELWHLATATLAFGLTWAIDYPTRRALIMDMLGARRVPSAMVLEAVALNGSLILGPLLGGRLIDLVSFGPTFIVSSSLYLIGWLLLFVVPSRSSQLATASEPALRRFLEGLSYVAGNRPIATVLTISVAANFLVFPYMQLLPVFARDVLRVGATEYGILASAGGIGALFGSLMMVFVPRLQRRPGMGFIIGALGTSMMLVIFAFSPNYGIAVALMFLKGVVQVGFMANQSTLVLLNAQERFRGQAMGTLQAAIGFHPLGNLQLGALVTVLGPVAALALSSSVGAAMLAIITWRSATLRRQ